MLTTLDMNTVVPLHTVQLADFPIIDLAVVKVYISSEREVYEPLLLDFLSSLDEFNARLTTNFNGKNWPLFAAEAHKLNGSAGYLGASQLLALCGQLQHVQLGCDEQQVSLLFEQLQQAFENLQHYQLQDDENGAADY